MLLRFLRIQYCLWNSNLSLKRSEVFLKKAEKFIHNDEELAEKLIQHARVFSYDAKAWSDLAVCYQEGF